MRAFLIIGWIAAATPLAARAQEAAAAVDAFDDAVFAQRRARDDAHGSRRAYESATMSYLRLLLGTPLARDPECELRRSYAVVLRGAGNTDAADREWAWILRECPERITDNPLQHAATGASCCVTPWARGVRLASDASRAPAAERSSRLVRAASEVLDAATRPPRWRGALEARAAAGWWLEQAGESDRAIQVFRALAEQLLPRIGQDPEEDNDLDELLGRAFFRLGWLHYQAGRLERSLFWFEALTGSRRMQRARCVHGPARLEDARVNIRLLQRRLAEGH